MWINFQYTAFFTVFCFQTQQDMKSYNKIDGTVSLDYSIYL